MEIGTNMVAKTNSYSSIWIMGPKGSVGKVVDSTGLIFNATYDYGNDDEYKLELD